MTSAQGAFLTSVFWVSMGTGYLFYFCVCFRTFVFGLEMYRSLGRDLDTAISRELRLFPYTSR